MSACRNCGLVVPTSGDRYCLWCGSAFRALSAWFDPPEIAISDGAEPLEIGFSVRSDGQAPTPVALEWTEETWLKLAPEAVVPDSLPPGETWTATCLLDPENWPAQGRRVRVGVADGSPHVAEYAELSALPMPEVTASLAPDATLRIDESGAQLFPLHLQARSPWEGVRVVGVEAVEEWVTVDANFTEPAAAAKALLSAEATAVVGTLPAIARPRELTVSLDVHLEGPTVARRVSVELPVAWPGELRVSGLGSEIGIESRPTWNLPPGAAHGVVIRVENPGGRPVTVESVAIEGGEDWVGWIDPIAANGSPFEVEPEPHPGRQLTLAVDLRHRHEAAADSVDIRFRTEAGDEVGFPFVIAPGRREVYDGSIAVDFGTTNSSVAAQGAMSKEPKSRLLIGSLPWAHQTDWRPGAVLPSQLLPFARPLPDTRLFDVPREDEDSHHPSLIQGFKRHFGSGERWPVDFVSSGHREERSVDALAQDYIARLLQDAERVLGRRLGQCSLAHPVRFRPSQISLLAEIVRDLGVDVIRTLPEPVAAAVEYMVADHGDEHDSPYNLLVFDIGGGTTDLALFRVYDGRSGGTREIRPEFLGLAGLRFAGGEDITIRLARWVLEGRTDLEAKGILNEEELAAARAVAPRATSSAWRTNPVLAKLFGWAETTKLDPKGDKAALQSLSELVDAFLSEHEMLEMAAGLLKGAGIESPDRILLVGRTWRIPGLQQRLEARFDAAISVPGAGVENDHLKEVVARGLCRLDHLQRFPSPFLFDFGSATPAIATARVGYAGYDERGEFGFREVIAQNDSLGTWREIGGVVLNPYTELRVLENTGSSNDIEHPEVSTVGRAILGPAIAEALGTEDLSGAEVLMRLTATHDVEVKARAAGREWDFTFERSPAR